VPSIAFSHPHLPLIISADFPLPHTSSYQHSACAVITSRQVCIQPHAVCFSSLYSFSITLPDNFCMVSCGKHYFWHCYCNLQEPRVIPDSSWFSAHFLLLPPVSLSAPLVHGLFRLAQIHGLAAFCADQLSLQQLMFWRNCMPCSMFRNIKKKHLSLFHSHQPSPWATMLQVSFISSTIRFHICVLHIHTVCSYYPCSHPSLLHPARFIPSPYPSHCMLTSDYWFCLLSHGMLVSWDKFSVPY